MHSKMKRKIFLVFLCVCVFCKHKFSAYGYVIGQPYPIHTQTKGFSTKTPYTRFCSKREHKFYAEGSDPRISIEKRHSEFENEKMNDNNLDSSTELKFLPNNKVVDNISLQNISSDQKRTLPDEIFLLYSIILGALTGMAVSAFKLNINNVRDLLFGDFLSLLYLQFKSPAPMLASALIVIIPLTGAAGVCILRFIFKEFPPGLVGQIDEVEKEKPFNMKSFFGKIVAAAVTLGSGNSLGPEGPSVEIGVSASRLLSEFFNLSLQRQQSLLAAGAAAGVAAGFNAPLAGVFFAFEIVKSSLAPSDSGADLSKIGVAATLLASMVSASTSRIFLHEELAFRPSAYQFENPLIELPLYLGLGLLSGIIAIVFKLALTKSNEVFKRLSDPSAAGKRFFIPSTLTPLIGGFACGVVSIFYPQVLFFGYDTLDTLVQGTSRYSPFDFAIFGVLKIFLSAVCAGAGLVGGTFAPSLFLGAINGTAYHDVVTMILDLLAQYLMGLKSLAISASGGSIGALASLLPDVISFKIAYAPAYAMVGSAALLSALFKAPLTGSLLMFELTRDYDIILPLMAAAGLASIVVDRGFAVVERVDKNSNTTEEDDSLSENNLMEDLLLDNFILEKANSILEELTVEKALLKDMVFINEGDSVKTAMTKLVEANTEFAMMRRESPWPQLPDRATLPLFSIVTLRDIQSIATRANEGLKSEELVTGGSLDRTLLGDNFEIVISLSNSASLSFAQKQLKRMGIKCLPVIDESDSGGMSMIGVVTADSIQRALRIEETARLLYDGSPKALSSKQSKK